jgi:hypothetical protein
VRARRPAGFHDERRVGGPCRRRVIPGLAARVRDVRILPARTPPAPARCLRDAGCVENGLVPSGRCPSGSINAAHPIGPPMSVAAVGVRGWEGAAGYQLYVLSFADGNGDGLGDLIGALERLDYLAWLGVDLVWLSPFYVSPLADWGLRRRGPLSCRSTISRPRRLRCACRERASTRHPRPTRSSRQPHLA